METTVAAGGSLARSMLEESTPELTPAEDPAEDPAGQPAAPAPSAIATAIGDALGVEPRLVAQAVALDRPADAPKTTLLAELAVAGCAGGLVGLLAGGSPARSALATTGFYLASQAAPLVIGLLGTTAFLASLVVRRILKDNAVALLVGIGLVK